MRTTLAIIALGAALADAHFHLTYPYWRGDSFAEGKSQWQWPCANVTQEVSSTNRTVWPLDGGSLVYTSSHPWVQAYVNLGIGDVVTGFNISLLASFNVTHNGTVCFSQIGAAALKDAGIKDGQTASLQVVNVNDAGNALYNCADIVFSSNATVLSGDQCQNSTGMDGYFLTSYGPNETSSTSSGSATASGSAASSTSSSGASVHLAGVGAWIGGAAAVAGALIL